MQLGEHDSSTADMPEKERMITIRASFGVEKHFERGTFGGPSFLQRLCLLGPGGRGRRATPALRDMRILCSGNTVWEQLSRAAFPTGAVAAETVEAQHEPGRSELHPRV